ncbi:MAG: response regulator, partial [Ignavibacteriaceae bacterium]
MKISYRILIINFAIVVLILGGSAVAYYSIMYNVLTSQQSKYLLNSANDFIYKYREELQYTEDDFYTVLKSGLDEQFNKTELTGQNLDFVFEKNQNSKNISREIHKPQINISHKNFTIQDFLNDNPSVIIKTYKGEDGREYYYGRVLNQTLLNNISQKIRSEIALIWNNTPFLISNEGRNQQNFFVITEAYNHLSSKNNFTVFSEGSSANDILTTIYKPVNGTELSNQLEFIIFNPIGETSDLKNSIKYILIVLGTAGVALSLILTMIFTGRIRKHISELSEATELTKSGNFKNKIAIKSNDEIGQLAGAFNRMLVDLDKNERAKNEYSEFITLINQNPTLSEISEASLLKIIKTAGFVVGALYTVDENNEINLASSYGLGNNKGLAAKESSFFNLVIKNKEFYELSFEENFPTVSMGIVDIEIKHLLMVPVIYSKRVIAILELGATGKPSDEAREYLSRIQEQLAIGITNATAFVKLKDLVAELKNLNGDIQKQNIQIRKQNETLVELHNKLREKAKELEIQKQKAEEATKLKSQFLASMSHELRTPMNSILGLTELILEETSLIGKNHERLEVVFKSSKRLMNLINDILDLSKIEAGKMELHNEDVMLEELIRDVETSISPLVNNKAIDFKLERNCNTRIIVNLEREKITQVLINLLGNAIKFTENGYVQLAVSVDSNKLRFDISDTGIGISKEDLAIIFEEFRQADGTTTRKFGGTGLGLAICKRISDLLEGSIMVKSEIGKGSIFTFTVPLVFVSEGSIEEADENNLSLLMENSPNPILIIDSDPKVRYTVGQYLVSKGYEVVYAEDGEQGVKKAIELQPFAITLDILLPKKNGWLILKELKENEKTKKIPVIVISIMGDKNLGYGFGAFDYYVKPISDATLHAALKKLENNALKKIEKIIVVDDDELEFDKYKKAFKDEKIRIDYIKDSNLAFSKILEAQPDLVIVDLMMPGVDGITLSHKLKSNKDTKDIPIIISTAKDLSDEEKNSLHNVVEEITLKSKGHPLDVLKIVRDHLKIQESISLMNSPKSENKLNIEEPGDSKKPTQAKNILGEVLIVDDDPDTLFTINEIVESCNYKTILAKNGVECLNKLENKLPDLILLDIMMPEMDGFQTLK